MLKQMFGVVLVVGALSACAMGDFVQNGDFADYSSWQASNSDSEWLAGPSYEVGTGAWGLKSDGKWVRQSIGLASLPASTSFQVGLYATGVDTDITATNQVSVTMVYWNDAGENSLNSIVQTKFTLPGQNNVWTGFTYSGVTPAGIDHSVLYLHRYSTDSSGTLAVDGVHQIPEPITLTLLGLGGFILRKRS